MAWFQPTNGQILAAIQLTYMKVTNMSQTLSDQVNAALAAESAMLTTLTANVAAIQADLSKVVGELTTGGPVTQDQVDKLKANNDALQAIVNASAPPASVP